MSKKSSQRWDIRHPDSRAIFGQKVCPFRLFLRIAGCQHGRSWKPAALLLTGHHAQAPTVLEHLSALAFCGIDNRPELQINFNARDTPHGGHQQFRGMKVQTRREAVILMTAIPLLSTAAVAQADRLDALFNHPG